MPTDLRVVLSNRPGALAEVLRILAEAGLNVGASCGDIRPGERWGYVHLLVDDPGTAVASLEAGGCEVLGVHDVEITTMENRPGALADVVSGYTDAGRNIEVFYTAPMEGAVVVGTEDMQRPRPGVQMKDAKY